MESAMNLIFQWKAEPAAKQGFISDCNPSQIHNYLTAVNYVIEESKLVKESSATEAINMAVARLKHEFHHLLTKAASPTALDWDMNTGGPISMALSCSFTHSSSMSTASWHNNDETCGLISEACNDLGSIARTMNSAGYTAEFTEIYTSVRKSFLFTHLRRLGIRKLSTSEKRDLVRLDQFKTHADNWIRASKVFYGILLPNEEKISAYIFDGTFADVCFANSVKDAKNELIMMFERTLITSCRSPNKLFKLLDLYNLLEEICQLLTSRTFSEPIIEQVEPVAGLCFQLLVVVRETVSDFVEALVQEVSPIDKVQGTIHEFTKYVMNYIRHTMEYDYILSRIIVSNPPTCFGDLKVVPPVVKLAEQHDEGKTPLARHVVLIIAVLIFKLEAKCKGYKDDDVLVHLFMTNNLHYIIKSIKSSPKLVALIGEDYTNNLKRELLKVG